MSDARQPTVAGPAAERRRLSVPEAARYLGVSESWLNKQRCKPAGAGPLFLRYGSKIAYDSQDLDSYMESRLCASTQDRAP